MHLWIVLAAVLIIASEARHYYPYSNYPSYPKRGVTTTQPYVQRSVNDVTVVDEKTGIQYNPYSKHHPGRHVCTNQRNVTYPVRSKRVFCKPTYKKYMVRCGTQWCEGVRLVYEKYHKDVVADANHTVVDYTCCPGWTQVNWRSHGCNKPVCARPCANGGKCVKPNICSCPPGYEGTFCETKTSVYSSNDCSCSPPYGGGPLCPSQCPVGCPGISTHPCPLLSMNAFPPCPTTCPPLCTPTCPSLCPPYFPMCPLCTGTCCASCAKYPSCSLCDSLCPTKSSKRNGLQDEPNCIPSCENGGVCGPAVICICPPGYIGNQCERDVDECKNKPCDQICYNTPGSYKCECKENFVLQKDGQTCRKETDDGALEARDLEQQLKLDKMDKRLQKLEKMMKEKGKNEVTKKDLESIYTNIDKMSNDITSISNRLTRLECCGNQITLVNKRCDSSHERTEVEQCRPSENQIDVDKCCCCEK